MSLFTKREHSLIFSWLKMSCFLKSMLLLKFMIWLCLNILNLYNILMLLNNCIFWWFQFDVTTKAPRTEFKPWSFKSKSGWLTNEPTRLSGQEFSSKFLLFTFGVWPCISFPNELLTIKRKHFTGLSQRSDHLRWYNLNISSSFGI